VIENAVNHQNVLHDFGLSLLWRASASGRDEFNKLNLGVYQEDLRKAFLAGCVPDSLRGKTGLLFQEFRNGTPEIDQSFEPYRLFKKSNEFKRLFGNFQCHVFGFPYGELLIRLGGDRPPNGYFDCQFDSFSGRAVLWTSSLSNAFPHWFFDAEPNKKVEKLLRYTFHNEST
jgi:hypothetical protein